MIEAISIVAFFSGWFIGASIREKRIRKEIEDLYRTAYAHLLVQKEQQYENRAHKAMYLGQRAYLEVMIETAKNLRHIEDMQTVLERQLEIVEGEIALENTKEILL